MITPAHASSEASPREVPRRALVRMMIVVFFVALVARSGWGLYRFSQSSATELEFDDERQYWLMADSLREGAGLKDELGFQATRMPLYPGVLSFFVGLPSGFAWAKALQWVIGAVGASLAAGTAVTFFGHRVGLIAGLLVALDPFLVFFSSLLLTETGYVVLITGFWWIVGSILRSRVPMIGRWIAAGAVAALCVYQRESSLGLVLAAFGVILLCKRFPRRDILGAFAATATIVLCLVPWGMRNQRVIGEWCWLTTRGGISLYDGVGPQATGASDLGSVKQMPAVRGLSEVQWNRYFLNESKRAMLESPTRCIKLAVTKMRRMWNPFPNVDSYQSRAVRLVSAVWVAPTFLCAVVGAVLIGKAKRSGNLQVVLILLLPAFYLSLVHCFFVGSVRYRLGAIPFLHMLAAFAAVALCDYLRGRCAGGGQSVAE